tara:strand:- start:4849 stop:5694 length:846 start_codon:yes stop_codon:yes gene_type:complete
MAINLFNGSILSKKVREIFGQRSKNSGAHPWMQEKRAWMRLHSNSSKGMTISGESSTWNQAGMYKEDSTGRITAAPTIESISIKTTGTAGSMRKADVKFKVYSYDQLKQVQTAFFIPGMSAVITWGWNMKSDGSPINPSAGVDNESSLRGITKKIKKWVERNDGNCDGMGGLISDFGWSKATGGGADSSGFDCSITLESPAKTYMTGPVNIPTCKACGCPAQGEDGGAKAAGGWVKQALKDQAESEMSVEGGEGSQWTAPNGAVMGFSIKFDQEYQEEPEA